MNCNIRRLLTSCAALALCSLLIHPASAVVIGYEDFDGGAINLSGTANVFDFGAGGGAFGDVFGRVSPYAGGSGTGGPFDVWDDSVVDTSGGGVFPGDSRGLAGRASTAFFALNDMDGSDVPPGDGSLNNATWTFNISGGAAVQNIQIDLAALGDFEAGSSDGFLIEARVDANAYQTIFQAVTNEAISKVYRLMDDGTVPVDTNDPLELFIDGSGTTVGTLDKSIPATGKFDTYTSLALAGQTGSTLDVRVSWAGSPSGSEPMGLDNITINGVPEPSSLVLLFMAGLVLLGFGSRRNG